MSKENLESRRKFFNKITIGFAGLALVGLIPKVLFAKKKRLSGIKVNIHPDAVKRNKDS